MTSSSDSQSASSTASIRSPEADTGARSVEESLSRITSLVTEQVGHDFSRYKSSTVRRRVQRRMQRLKLDSYDEYFDRLRANDDEVHRLIDELLIGVTSFFRDPDDFAVLAERVIPELFENRSPGDPVRIWVPACATGEEAYSVAILCAEYLDERGQAHPVQIFASDIDQKGLSSARRGVYPRSIAEEVSEQRLQRFFRETNDGFAVIDRLRDMCLFSMHDLTTDPVFSSLDLISCRNLLIYLDVELQDEILEKFRFALKPDAFLFLGPSETIRTHGEHFRSYESTHRIFRCDKSLTDYPARSTQSVAPLSHLSSSDHSDSGNGIFSRMQRLVLERYTPCWIVVDRDRRVVCNSGDTAPYLTLSRGNFENDVLKMARSELRAGLRSALGEASNQNPATVHKNLSIDSGDGLQPVRITVEPIRPPESTRELFLIVFQEFGEPLVPSEGSELSENTDELIAHLEQELSRAHRDLDETVRELEYSNEELRSSNEELLSMNEELQSANEEMETAKEEVQAANRELAKTNTDLENLLKSTRIATLFLDEQLRIQRMTPAVETLYNLKPGDIDRPITDVTHRVETMPPLPEPEEVYAASSPIEDVLRTDDDRWYARRVLPYRNSNGDKKGMVVTFVDITDRRQARDHASHLAAIVESSEDAILSKTLDGIITSWNPAAERMYGYTRDEMIGSHVKTIIPEGRRLEFDEFMHRLRSGERLEPFKTQRMHRDGHLIDVSLTVSAVRSDDGEIIAISSMARDITERIERQRKLEEAIAEAQAANKSKSEFLANMSHEIRTPMTAILGYADLLLNYLDDPDNRQCVETIRRNGNYLLEIINDILDLSKIEAGKLEINRQEIAPEQLVVDVVSLMGIRARNKSLKLKANFASRIPETITTDPVRLRQILVNLVGNAIKFTEQGRVILSVGLTKEDKPKLEFSVADTGIGMTEEAQKTLFEPFAQGSSANTGTGLGLSICKRLVRMLGGAISVSSEPNVGTTVRFTVDVGSLEGVPLIEPGAVIDAPEEPISMVSTQLDARLLVADDRREIRLLAAHYLEDVGASVETATDGREAVDIVKETAADGEPFDAVVIDMQMPVMDGYQATKKLRRLGYEVPIIALTAAAMDADRARCLDAGCDDYVAKPVSADELITLVAEHVEA